MYKFLNISSPISAIFFSKFNSFTQDFTPYELLKNIALEIFCFSLLHHHFGIILRMGYFYWHTNMLFLFPQKKQKHKTVKQTRPSFDSHFPSSYYLYSRSVCSAQLLINSEYSLFVTVLLSFSLKYIPVKLLPYCSTKIAFIKVTGELYVAGYGGGYREINRIV